MYKCEQCDFDVHAFCTKFSREIKGGFHHCHDIIMRQCLPRKSLACHLCNGEIKEYTWYYTFRQQPCTLTIHPLCTLYPWNQPCIFDSSHQLRMQKIQRSSIVVGVGHLGFHGRIIASMIAMWTYIQIVYITWMKRYAIGMELMKDS